MRGKTDPFLDLVTKLGGNVRAEEEERGPEREDCRLPSGANGPVGRCPPWGHYCGEGAALALLPAPFRPACLTSRFICRQSARVF